MKRLFLMPFIFLLCLIVYLPTTYAADAQGHILVGYAWWRDSSTPTHTTATINDLQSHMQERFSGYANVCDVQQNFDMVRDLDNVDYGKFCEDIGIDYLIVLNITDAHVEHTTMYLPHGMGTYDLKDVSVSVGMTAFVKGEKKRLDVSAGGTVKNSKTDNSTALRKAFMNAMDWNLEIFGRNFVPFNYDKYQQEQYKKDHTGNWTERL